MKLITVYNTKWMLGYNLSSFLSFSVRMGKSWRVSLLCAEAMDSGTTLCQNATVCLLLNYGNCKINGNC